MENLRISLGEGTVAGYKTGLPVYSLTLNIGSEFPKIYGNREGFLVNIAKGKESSIIAFGAIEKMKTSEYDLVSIYLDRKALKDYSKDDKINIFIAPKISINLSNNLNKATHDVYCVENNSKAINIGFGHSLDIKTEKENNFKKKNPLSTERFDFTFVGGMNKDGLISLDQKVLIQAMDANKQNAVTVNFKSYTNSNEFYGSLSDKGNLNRCFDYKVTLPRNLVEDNTRINNLQALMVTKPETRNDLILVTFNTYLNSLNELLIGNKKTHSISEHDIQAIGWSKQSFERDVTDKNRNFGSNQDKSKDQDRIPTVDQIKQSKIDGNLYNIRFNIP